MLLSFRERVRGIETRGWLTHPELTVTVADPDRFFTLVRDRLDGG